MNSVIVKDVSDGKEYSFPILSESMSINDLKQQIEINFSKDRESIIWKYQQVIVINDKITKNDDLIIDLVVSSCEKDDCIFFLLTQPPEDDNSTMVNEPYDFVEYEDAEDEVEEFNVEPCFDRSSLLAAATWYNENLNNKLHYKVHYQQQQFSSSSSSSSTTNIFDDQDYTEYDESSTLLLTEVLADFIEYDSLGLPCHGEEKKAATAPAPQRLQAGRGELRWLNMHALFAVITRIIIICMWFGRGGVSSFPTWKIVAVVAAIIVSYLFEIGLVTRGLRQIASAQLAVWLNRVGLGALAAGVGVGVGAVPPNETVYETMVRLAHAAAAIPTEKHFVYDINAVLVSLVLSLFPSWQPRAATSAVAHVAPVVLAQQLVAQPQQDAAAAAPVQAADAQ